MRHFTADLHLGHVNIIGYTNRPFADVDAMTEGLIENWNETVAPDDEVWILGDFAMGKIADNLPHALRLNGTKHLVPGNHDRCWTGHKKTGDWTQKYEDVGFIIEPNEVELDIDGQTVLVCHFPYSGDSRHEERYTEHRPADRGMILLHGHVHDLWRIKGHQFNVGIDVNGYRPVAEETIIRDLKGK